MPYLWIGDDYEDNSPWAPERATFLGMLALSRLPRIEEHLTLQRQQESDVQRYLFELRTCTGEAGDKYRPPSCCGLYGAARDPDLDRIARLWNSLGAA